MKEFINAIGLIDGIKSKRFTLTSVFIGGVGYLTREGVFEPRWGLVAASVALVVYVVMQTIEDVVKRNDTETTIG